MSFVQAMSNGTDGTTGASITATFSATVTSGNMVMGLCTWGSGTTSDLQSITDNGTGGTWVIKRRIADGTNGQSAASFYGYGWSSPPSTVTANFSPNQGYRGITVQEHSGQASGDPIDGTNEAGQLETAPGTGADGADSGTTLTPSVDNCTIFTGSVCTGATGTTFTAGSVGTEPANAEHTAGQDISLSSEYEIQTTATARNGAMTVNSNTAHITMAIVFKPTGGGGPSTGQKMPAMTQFTNTGGMIGRVYA